MRLPMLTATGTVLATAVALTGASSAAAASGPDRSQPQIAVVSNPDPGLISGGDALLRITPAGTRPVRLTVNGRVADGFARQPDGTLLGLVTGLRDGANRITAESHGRAATLTVINHPATGPIFAGPQPMPFYCETTAFGLAPATQPSCAAPAVVSYQYHTTAGAFAPLADPAARPADLATTTVGGRAVPYLVRIETGTIDRAVYQTAALYDGSAPSPLRPDTSWNGRLVYAFGGGCSGGHHQGSATGGVLNDLFLSRGYAVASSTLNVLETNCNIPTSAEAAMMVKEHFIEVYGPVAHTIGWGASGGGIQQYTIADSYPGILDGIIPTVGFPDAFTALKDASDCRLLDRFFAGAGGSFTERQRRAVAGFEDYDTCTSWDTYFDLVTPTGRCSTAIPAAALWNATTNPGGVKCTLAEAYANQFGRDPATGFVRGTLDNVGVQYGLAALRGGEISAAQFVALNAGIGGYDAYGATVPARTRADDGALRAAYRDDLRNSAGLGLRATPIIDYRLFMDFDGPINDVHTAQWSYVMRARLQAANGTAANQVIVESHTTPDQAAASGAYVLSAMDRWLTGIEADRSARSRQAKVIADKPADVGDGCYQSADHRIQTPLTYPATGPCAASYPIGSSPRLQAGENLAQTALKCALRPIDFADYQVRFTKAEQARLRAAFPAGVCDYTRPGPGQNQRPATWIDYGDH
ncbi:DUF6351 family protein [Dactylosporangium sp. CA-092794]|uniref:DUF6351 family protein n=1 Tax=Dactylosporangium sp. CA-092794 TaxID=3239929 RepID=UPI003D8C3C6C